MNLWNTKHHYVYKLTRIAKKYTVIFFFFEDLMRILQQLESIKRKHTLQQLHLSL